eukprot:Rhum_TRINITY_DN4587_c0_g1::Rhum_TRINITY_DN4587_c0_g1_i1::g.14920::m.14920/K03363/CDC20; cell division cycle 20, cofactor of APC complex
MKRYDLIGGEGRGNDDYERFFDVGAPATPSECGTPCDTPIAAFRQKMLDSHPPNLASVDALKDSFEDRLVPDRGGMSESIGVALYQSHGKLANTVQQSSQVRACDVDRPAGESYKLNLACSLFDTNPHDVTDRVLRIGNKTPSTGGSVAKRAVPLEHDKNLRVIYARNKTRNFRGRAFRYIPQTPERILDAPDLTDDYYLNLLDWSQSNILSVALNQAVYLWNADSGDITQLTQTREPDNIITGISFSKDSTNTLAVGTHNADVELWDVVAGEKTLTLKGHLARVVSLAWNGNLLASGSRDSAVLLHDPRTSGGPVATLNAHEQEVCGLQWSLDGSQLASGGNDNLLHIWDNRQRHEPRLRLTAHTAAVKAIGWSPHQSGLLATGGGTADRTIRFWNTSTGECINTIDTKSQVCSLLWSTNRNEVLTSHGYSENQLSLWKYPSMKRIANLTGHSSRVLHLALSPDGQTVVSAAGDETIRFWKCFAEEKTKSRRSLASPNTPFSPLGIR